MLDHQLDATVVTENGKRRLTKFSMITITQAALTELRSLPNGETQWIQVTQLGRLLRVKEEFAGIDIYSVIAKFFYFLVYY